MCICLNDDDGNDDDDDDDQAVSFFFTTLPIISKLQKVLVSASVTEPLRKMGLVIIKLVQGREHCTYCDGNPCYHQYQYGTRHMLAAR